MSSVRIVHAMAPPVVEHPGLARGHVDDLIAAMELHFGPREHRNVQAHPVEPVIVDVRMLRHDRVRLQTHEARAAPHDTEAREHLKHVRALLQMRRRQHDAIDVIVLAAIGADQPYRAVPLDLVWMVRPGRSAAMPPPRRAAVRHRSAPADGRTALRDACSRCPGSPCRSRRSLPPGPRPPLVRLP